mmetsp:Transcript_30090/g.63856  ORF Transcript_30090/g.63856 Transcript_30090/m.63856 type:complete len:349 (-) Transcript_30090:12-1058(-)
MTSNGAYIAYLVQGIDFGIRIEQQIEVLQRFRHEEGLHPILDGIGVVHVRQRSVTILRFAVPFDALEDLPSPFAINWISGQLIQIVKCLHRLGPQDVKLGIFRNLHVVFAVEVPELRRDPRLRPGVEIHVLRRDPRVRPGVHLVARVRQRPGRPQVPPRPVRVHPFGVGVGAQRERAAHEARQVVHLGHDQMGDPVGQEGEAVGLRLPHEVAVRAVHGLVPHLAAHVLLPTALDSQLEHVLVGRVVHGAEGHRAAREGGTSAGAALLDVLVKQPVGRLHFLQYLEHAARPPLVVLLPRLAREVPVLHLLRRHLPEDGRVLVPAVVARPAVAEVDELLGQSRRGRCRRP